MQQQKTHSTEYNRYPDIFRICKEYFGETI